MGHEEGRSFIVAPRNIDDLVRPDLLKISEYVPIEPPDVLVKTRGLAPQRIIKLDGNENPYGPSPKVLEALGSYQGFQYYPDPGQRELMKLLEEYVGLDSKYIIGGAGSDEIIDLLLRAFISPGDRVIDCVPTFGMYRFSTQVCGGHIVDVPRDEDYQVVTEKVLDVIDYRTKIIFIASPNNPSGLSVSPECVHELLKTGILIVIDEAYCEFSGKTLVNEVQNNENLVVLRTFSKWAGLAGLRVGYGVMQESVSRHLWKIKPPYNVNVAAQVAVRASMEDLPYIRSNIAKMISERERMYRALQEMDFVRPFPSEANFVFCHLLRGRGVEVRDRLREKGVFVRYFDAPLTRNAVRISVGRPEETDILLDALREIGQSLKSSGAD